MRGFRLKVKAVQIMLARWAVSFLFAVFVLPVFYLCEPFKKIRIGIIGSMRFGLIALHLEYLLRKKRLAAHPDNTFLILFSGPPVNRQLLEMFKRHDLNIIENPLLYRIIFVFLQPFLKKTRFYDEFTHKASFHFFKHGEPNLTFLPEEEARGKKWLESVGIGERDWFVCIFARDSDFLNTLFPNSFIYGSLVKNDWSYYNFRCANINSFRLAIQYIVEQNGFVIRMGYLAKVPLEFKHPKVIDYALNHRSDFLDVYLPAKCRFFLGTPGGGSDLPVVFNKPRVLVHCQPAGYVPRGKNDLYIPKKVIDLNTKQYVSFAKIIGEDLPKVAIKYDESNHLIPLGLDYEDHSESDILKVAKEMNERLNGTFKEESQYKTLLERHYGIFPSNNIWRNNKTPIGHDFLIENQHLFF